jgi:hypothetical protein
MIGTLFAATPAEVVFLTMELQKSGITSPGLLLKTALNHSGLPSAEVYTLRHVTQKMQMPSNYSIPTQSGYRPTSPMQSSSLLEAFRTMPIFPTKGGRNWECLIKKLSDRFTRRPAPPMFRSAGLQDPTARPNVRCLGTPNLKRGTLSSRLLWLPQSPAKENFVLCGTKSKEKLFGLTM